VRGACILRGETSPACNGRAGGRKLKGKASAVYVITLTDTKRNARRVRKLNEAVGLFTITNFSLFQRGNESCKGLRRDRNGYL
jgi:hypothetical protein